MNPGGSVGRRVYIETLGCPKNEADSSRLGRRLQAAGIQLASDPEEAEQILVNTCGFVEDAREESIGALLELTETYPDRRVLAMGCLVQRYREELRQGLPEVAGWYGLTEWDLLVADLAGEGPSTAEPPGSSAHSTPTAGGAHAFIKISDGCDHRCSFCAIPGIKGPYRALPLSQVLEQAEAALDGGARELVLVGQDTAVWQAGAWTLPGLIRRLSADPRTAWIRMMYLQPEHVDDALLELFARESKVCRYLDIPFEHASGRILRSMRRGGDGEQYLELLARARTLMPDGAVRSTFIVGYPGETDEDFAALLDFVGEAAFDYAGVFGYSPEEGTRAAELPGRVPDGLIRERLNRLSRALNDRAEAKARETVGWTGDLLVDQGPERPDPSAGGDGEPQPAVGRTYRQAPDIDGVTYLESSSAQTGPIALGAGSVVRVRISEAVGLDLVAELLEAPGGKSPELGRAEVAK